MFADLWGILFLVGIVLLMMGFIRWLYIEAAFVLSLGMGLMFYVWIIVALFRFGILESLSRAFPLAPLVIVLGGLGWVFYNAFKEAVEEFMASLGYAIGGSILIFLPLVFYGGLPIFIIATVVTVIICMISYHFASDWIEKLADEIGEE